MYVYAMYVDKKGNPLRWFEQLWRLTTHKVWWISNVKIKEKLFWLHLSVDYGLPSLFRYTTYKVEQDWMAIPMKANGLLLQQMLVGCDSRTFLPIWFSSMIIKRNPKTENLNHIHTYLIGFFFKTSRSI